jgi:hypothetical protein
MKQKRVAAIGALVLSIVFLAGVGTSLSGAVDVLRGHEGSVRNAISAIQAGDTRKALEVLDALHGGVIEARALLNGLVFRGERKMLTDPFLLPAGVYRARLTTEGFANVTIYSAQGERLGFLFTVSRGGAAGEGATTLYRSNGRRVMVQFDNITAPYQLVFERMQ